MVFVVLALREIVLRGTDARGDSSTVYCEFRITAYGVTLSMPSVLGRQVSVQPWTFDVWAERASPCSGAA